MYVYTYKLVMQIREASLDLIQILGYQVIPFDLTSRKVITENRRIRYPNGFDYDKCVEFRIFHGDLFSISLFHELDFQ